MKLTKRQVKEDRFTTFMLTSKERFQESWQFYVVGIVVVLLVVSAVAYYFNSRAARTAEAADKFARALLDYQNGDDQIAILGFNQILDEYGTTPSAGNATYLLGQINLGNRNYDEAVRYLEMYLTKYDDPLNRGAALAGIATAEEDRGNYAAAAAAFVSASEEYPGGPLQADYELGALRNFLQLGEVDSAEARLNILKEYHAGTPYTQKAIRLFSEKGNI